MELNEALARIYKEIKERLDIQNQPKVFINHDEENAKNIFGKTAYYSPGDESIVLYITGRHPKDVCRSFAHELVHHHQNERGDLNLGDASSPNYAQEDGHMRKMEMEAYLKGNMMFRDFEDNYKKQMKEYTGTGASGGNATDGNDITSPRPFSDDEEERDSYTKKNVYGGDGRHYKNEPAFKNPNAHRFTKFEETMKKSDIHKIIKETIQEVLNEVGADAYGSATNLTKGLNVAKSRFTKTGRPPGVWEGDEEKDKEGKKIETDEVEILDDVEGIENVTININEDEIENNARRIYKAIIKMDSKSGGNYYKNLFGTLRKGFEFTDIDPNNITGDQAAQLNLFHSDLIRASKGKERLVSRNF